MSAELEEEFYYLGGRVLVWHSTNYMTVTWTHPDQLPWFRIGGRPIDGRMTVFRVVGDRRIAGDHVTEFPDHPAAQYIEAYYLLIIA